MQQAGMARRPFSARLRGIDEAVAWMQALNGPHGLRVGKPDGLELLHHGTTVGRITTGWIRYTDAVTVQIDHLPHSYCIGIPLEGEQLIDTGARRFVSEPGVGVIISPFQPVRMALSEQCSKIMLRIERRALEGRLQTLLGRSLGEPLVFDTRMDLRGGARDWFALLQRLRDTLDDEQGLCDLPDVWSSFETGLITTLLYSQPHNYSAALFRTHDSRPAYLAVLQERLRERAGQALELAAIADLAGVSRDRLYRDFQQFCGQSPVAFHRGLRLEHVRQRLLQAGRTETVSSIAMDCGFAQLGRFASEYRQRFGELPSQTLAHRGALPAGLPATA